MVCKVRVEGLRGEKRVVICGAVSRASCGGGGQMQMELVAVASIGELLITLFWQLDPRKRGTKVRAAQGTWEALCISIC